MNAGRSTGMPQVTLTWRAGLGPHPAWRACPRIRLIDLIRPVAGALHYRTASVGPELHGRGAGEPTAELADRRAHGAGEEDRLVHCSLNGDRTL